MRPIKLLTFSSLYPNTAMPRHGVFVEARLRKLLAEGGVDSRVVAPVPWFPSKNPMFGSYADFARVPYSDERSGIPIDYPRFVRIPKVGMSSAPFSMAYSAGKVLRRHIADGYDFDIIDAHYFYPDGIAAMILGQRLSKPVIITARGTDLNLIPRYRIPRRLIQWAAAKASGLITVCAALKDSLVELGVPGDSVTVLRNGVDLEFFQPVERAVAREKLGIESDSRILISVGLLIDRKGHDIPIRALADLPGVRLLIAGDGEQEYALKQLALKVGVAERVTFLGGISHQVLRDYLNAADALVLASSREGWANVLLEAMACATPVIASNVWGTPEVVAGPEAGVLMPERTPAAFVSAYKQLDENYPQRAATRQYAEKFSWDETSTGQLALMKRVLAAAGD